MSAGDLRASDAERETTAEVLRRATAEGRLDPDELDERLGRAYAARTRAELDELTRDLPAANPAPRVDTGSRAVERPDRWTAPELRARAAGFVVPNLVAIGVWLLSGADGGFWPAWVLLATTVALVASLVRGPEADRAHRERRGHRRRL